LQAALIAYFPLGSGLLNSPEPTKRLSFMQRRFLASGLQRDGCIIAIPGSTSPDHVEHNSRALGWQLTGPEFEEIDHASSAWKNG
jgi:diketogulonate reductase-like aldo/keto reductase